ncbi:MAG: M48 family metallopeptidase [Nitrospirae bacterium]|nr:M48 family metallopeptidase [Nitrospirota bacterium]
MIYLIMPHPENRHSSEQLNLFIGLDREALAGYFEKATGKAVSLVITDNSSSMLSVKTHGGIVSVRLHRMFLRAGADVISEIAEFIKKRRGKTPLLRKFLKENSHCLQRRPARNFKIRTEGKRYNLLHIFESVNNEYFGGRISAEITWGRCSRNSLRKKTLGSYSSHTNTIRINPVLDKKTVPRYYIEFIVYHEMLHADIGIKEKNGRRSVHSREFKMRERLFREYEKAMAWTR